eukprot:6922697-Alexandrium_andersonii.AAC.1
MSASLVGSEMCIRDRFVIVGSPPCTDWCGLNTYVDHPRMNPAEVAERTVSYTHLTLPTICSV